MVAPMKVATLNREDLSLNRASYRERCLQCLRAKSVCLCSEIQKIPTTFRVVLLQHPHERRNSIGTARLTHLCLSNSRLICGQEFDHDAEVNAILDDPGNECVVLFPGQKSTLIDASNSKTYASKINLVVFVIDGTWSHAKGMMRKSERLRALPQVCFNPETPSQYKIRKQPKALCLSTVEAVHRLVQILNPESNPDRMIALFSAMVENQIQCAAKKNLRELSRSRT